MAKVTLKGKVELREVIERIIFEDEERGCSIDELQRKLREMVPQGELSGLAIADILNKLVVERKVKLWFPIICTDGNTKYRHTVHFLPR